MFRLEGFGGAMPGYTRAWVVSHLTKVGRVRV